MTKNFDTENQKFSLDFVDLVLTVLNYISLAIRKQMTSRATVVLILFRDENNSTTIAENARRN